MTAPTRPDFGRTAGDYATYRPDFHPRLYHRLATFGIGLPAQKILDIGAGTGLLGRGLATINPACTIVECDPSLSLLRQATSPSRIAARAEHLPFADASFDAVLAGQCWHWFDRALAPREIARVLRPAGRLAIIYQTYLPIEGNVAAASERLILKFRPGWRHSGGVGINGQALKDLQIAGYTQIESFSFDIEVPYTRHAWQGFIRTCSAVGPTLSADELARFDAEHASMLAAWPQDMSVPHRVFAAVAVRP